MIQNARVPYLQDEDFSDGVTDGHNPRIVHIFLQLQIYEELHVRLAIYEVLHHDIIRPIVKIFI